MTRTEELIANAAPDRYDMEIIKLSSGKAVVIPGHSKKFFERLQRLPDEVKIELLNIKIELPACDTVFVPALPDHCTIHLGCEDQFCLKGGHCNFDKRRPLINDWESGSKDLSPVNSFI